MSESLDKFVNLLLRAELITEEQLHSVRKQLEAEGQAAEDDNLAQLLADSGHLTEFQADEIKHGKVEHLVVGDYLILHPVGRGGMGQVFKARHSVMKREVAVKFTLANEEGKIDQNAIDRFQQEVEAASKLSHPNIVSSLDAGRRGDVWYLVMEYVRGRNLAEYVRECGPMSFRQALDCTLQAAQGLEYAHSKGVVHRDIKPSNLLMTSDGQVKVLDMGLARNAYDDQSQTPVVTNAQLTHSGQLLGTVDFMAPEQAIDPRLSDGRADIYSLGCTLYFLLTGALPFRRDGKTTMSRIIAHRETPIPSLCAERVDVPKSFQRIFEKMMAKQVARRYQTVSELIHDLRKAQIQLQSNAQPMAETVTMVTRRRVSPVLRWGLAAVVIGIPLAAGVAIYQANQPAMDQQAVPGYGNVDKAGPALASGPQDLFRNVDLSRHIMTGSGWELDGGDLIVPSGTPSKLRIPTSFPADFQLRIVVTRLAGSGPFVIGISEEGRRFFLLMDAARGGNSRMTALGTKAGRLVVSHQNVLFLDEDQPVDLVLMVAPGKISLDAHGKTILAWEGNLQELSLGAGWGIGDGDAVLIGSNDKGSFEVSHFELIPNTPGNESGIGSGLK